MRPARQHYSLLVGFIYRELSFRFAGSALGMIWAFIGPILLLAIYSLILGQFFRQQQEYEGVSYTLFVAAGLWPWMMFADGVMRGMTAIQANGSLVKKVAFPHILLVTAAVAAAFLQHLVGYVIVMLLLATYGATIQPAGIPLAACYLAMLFLMTLGVAALLASLQTLLRDVEQVVAPAMMMLHYLTPVLYPLAMIPEAYRSLLALNPLAIIVTRLRENLFGGFGFQASDLGVLCLTLAMVVAGYAVFHRLSPYFEDFL